MQRIWTISGAGFALFVAACSAEPASNVAGGGRSTPNSAEKIEGDDSGGPVANDTVPVARLSLASDGLMFGGSHQVAFGAAEAAAEQGVQAALGAEGKRSENSDCSAGPLGLAQYPGGLTLFFQDGKFVGWDVDGRERGGFAAPKGLAIGATRQHLQDAGDLQMTASTIGAEFRFDGISGLLSSKDPTGTVTNLWAGTTCILR